MGGKFEPIFGERWRLECERVAYQITFVSGFCVTFLTKLLLRMKIKYNVQEVNE